MHEPDLSSVRVLVCDDNQFMCTILRGMLTTFGFKNIYEANNGAAAYEIFLTKSPDLAIIDWEMPEMNGLQLAKKMRTQEASNNIYVPIIMITGHSDIERVKLARDVGVTEFMCKPLAAKMLYKRILSVLLDPRPFVNNARYFGPDRRRFRRDDYNGPEKRTKKAALIETKPQITVLDV